MERHVVKPAPSGASQLPLSPAVVAGSFVFVSGQVAVDRSTSQFSGGDVAAQTHQVIANLREILEAAGSSLDHVVKANVYLGDINEFGAFNNVYRTDFPSDPPARTTVQAVLLPPYAVEIDVGAITADRSGSVP